MSKRITSDSSQQGFVHLFLLAGALAATGILASLLIQTSKVYPQSTSTAVLGESENNTRTQNQMMEQQREQMNVQLEATKQETETENSNEQKNKPEVTDDKTKEKEVEQGDLKSKNEAENVKTEAETENLNRQKNELKQENSGNTENEAANELEKEGIKIATEGGQPIFARNRIAARVNFPLSVDPLTNSLIVTTPAGQKTVTVLPDKAVQNMLNNGIISQVASPSANEETKNLGSLNGMVDLEDRNNEMVYKVPGVKTSKIFGLIPVSMPVTAYVSAQTGNLVTKEQSLLANLIQLLSR